MRFRIACISLAAALSVTALGVSTAHAVGPLSGTKVRNWNSGFVLGVAGNATTGHAQITYQTDTDDLAQKWAIDPVTSDTFMLRNLNSDMCITALNNSATGIVQRPCDPRWDEQVWKMIDSGKASRWQLQNQALSQCLNPASTGANANARVIACSATNDWNTHSFDVR
ncbi:RICIN domain-containing protein [Streptomyces flaveolus]|uniref:RICIN domain-containing protein n=1 Tax=Streptomyces flaveolus TaxID=67297 RepID=UPI0033A75927